MAAARGRIGSFKHRIVGLRTTPGPIPAERLRAAMRAGLEDQVDHLRSPSDSFSLPAWRKWGRLMTDERNAKAWPRVFADGHGHGVPMNWAKWVKSVFSVSCWPIALAMPKSMTLTTGVPSFEATRTLRRLDVAVDDALLMGVLHGLADVDEKLQPVAGLRWFSSQYR